MELIQIILHPICNLSFNALLIGSKLNINAPIKFGKLARIVDKMKTLPKFGLRNLLLMKNNKKTKLILRCILEARLISIILVNVF